MTSSHRDSVQWWNNEIISRLRAFFQFFVLKFCFEFFCFQAFFKKNPFNSLFFSIILFFKKKFLQFFFTDVRSKNLSNTGSRMTSQMFGPKTLPYQCGVSNDLWDVRTKNLTNAGFRTTFGMFGPKTLPTRGPERPFRC